MFIWFVEEARIRKRAAGKSVHVRAIPPEARQALATLLRRRDDSGAAASERAGGVLGLVLGALAAFALLAMAAMAHGLAAPVLTLLGVTAFLTELVRFAWNRWAVTLPPGRYVYGTGIVEVAPSGLVRFIPQAELNRRWNNRVVRTGSSSTGFWDLSIEAGADVLWSSTVGAGLSSSADAAKQAVETRLLQQASAAGDPGRDPFAWALRPDVWASLSPSSPAAAGGARGVPLLLQQPFAGLVGLVVFALPLGGLYAAFQLLDEGGFGGSGSSFRCGEEMCSVGTDVCARDVTGPWHCMPAPPVCAGAVGCGCLGPAFPDMRCEDHGGGDVTLVRRAGAAPGAPAGAPATRPARGRYGP